jgi:hypothetical protein
MQRGDKRALLDVHVWIRVTVSTIQRAIAALRDSVTRKHIIASNHPNTSFETRLRNQADSDHTAGEELKTALKESKRDEP